MRISRLSVILPVLALVSANLDHEQFRRHKHSERARLVARQRSSAGVLDPLLGGSSSDEDVSTTARAPVQSTVISVTPTRTSITSTEDDESTTPTPSASSTVSITSARVSSSLVPSSSSSVISSQSSVSASASNSSTSAGSSSSSNTSTAESSTSSAPASAEASMSLSVDAGGETIVVTVMQSVVTESATRPQAPASSSTESEKTEDDDGPAIPIGAIIGISVGAGVVILTLIGLAVWRMKKRSVDDDDAIRWPELNRHGDSDAHHALPAVQTGKHGIETSPLERSNSNSSSIFAHSVAPAYDAGPVPMALNGSNFGGTSSLDDEYYEKSQSGHGQDEHTQPAYSAYDLDTDYTSYPPVVQPHSHSGHHDGDLSDDERLAGQHHHLPYGQYRQ